MAEKEIEIVISNDGTVTVEQKGWKGKKCHGAVDDLLKMLGKVATKKKKEYLHKEKTRDNTRAKR